jgi:hypothetical protein
MLAAGLILSFLIVTGLEIFRNLLVYAKATGTVVQVEWITLLIAVTLSILTGINVVYFTGTDNLSLRKHSRQETVFFSGANLLAFAIVAISVLVS